MRIPQARIEDGVPVTAGWFVVNARDTRWLHGPMRSFARFGGQGEAHFDDLGIGLYRLAPGQAMALYHHEAGQEDFLVLRGRCRLLIEGEERVLAPWDFAHCPPRTGHTIVAEGDEPALVLAVGARVEKGSARYPAELLALERGVGVPEGETPDAVYADWGDEAPGPAPPGEL
jgi:uncharacterized cupin superfamily protein